MSRDLPQNSETGGDWVLIDNDDALAQALAQFSSTREIAVDTEFMRRNTYYPQVALLQLCAGDQAILVDPLAVDDLDPLRRLLTDPHVDKLLHSCSEDLEVFRRWLGVVPAPLLDTQRAMAILGEGFGIGYGALVQRVLGVTLEKGETRSDWLRRPLSRSQCHYAAQDVLQLWRAWPTLRERLNASGRMTWLREEGDELARTLLEREAESHRRIKGAGKLSPRNLAALDALLAWREQRARTRDKPRGWILDDKACMALAQDLPENTQALSDLDVMPVSVQRKHGDDILACVQHARTIPVAELPPVHRHTLDAMQRGTLKTLRLKAAQIAEDAGVSPEILVSASDLELLIQQAAGEAISEPRRWHGWRKSLVIDPLGDSLSEVDSRA